MFMENIKKYGMSFLLAFTILLSGCQTTEKNPQVSDSNTSAPLTDKTDTITTIPDKDETVTTIVENEADTTATEGEPAAVPAETTERVLEPIPEEWIPIENYQYTFDNFESLMSIDNSQGDIKDIVRLLTYKSIMLHYTLLGSTYKTDFDHPITYGEEEITICPVSSDFFTDVKSFYKLVSDIYEDPEKKCIYDPSDNSIYYIWASNMPELLFVEIDGKMYVNPNCCIKRGGGPEPFTETSYIEITDEYEDACWIRWHYPDVEKLNEPDKYVDYHYYRKTYKVIYSGGEWHLDDRIGY